MGNGIGPTLRPLVSIVTPAFNQGAFLRETIDSVLAQDYTPIEYIVIDDGSTDTTPDIVAAYGSRITSLRHENRGQTATINRGFELSSGTVLAWLNSDDTLIRGAVAAAVGYLASNPEVDIVFGDTLFTDAEGRALRRSAARGPFAYERFVVEAENPIPQPSAFIRRRVVETVGPLDVRRAYFMDWDFWLRAGLRHRIAYTGELLSSYRLHAQSNTVSRTARIAGELESVYLDYFQRADIPAGIRRHQAEAMANMYLTRGGYSVHGGDRRAAARAAVHAVLARPVMFLRWRNLKKALYCLRGGGVRRRGRDDLLRARL